MSELIRMIAIAVGAGAAGNLAAWPWIFRLRQRLAAEMWQVRHDPLTQLLSRTGLAGVHQAWRRTDQSLTVVLLDLDEFKTVNDSYGHQAGDELLREVGRRIRAAADRYGGAAARLSGDEFAVLLRIQPDQLVRAVHDIATCVTADPATITVDGQPVTLRRSASAGAVTGCSSDPLADLLHHADIAVYHAKHANVRYVVYEPGLTMPDSAGPHRRRLRDRRPKPSKGTP